MQNANSIPPTILVIIVMMIRPSLSVYLSDAATHELVVQRLEISYLLTQIRADVRIPDPEPDRSGMHEMHHRFVEGLCTVLTQRLIRLVLSEVHVL